MAAFDLNSLYFIKNNEPVKSDFDSLMGEVGKGFNLGKAYRENYNKNSLQNLIAQREKEGTPYYMLGNEAAKWDLEAARGMDKDRIGMIKDQYEMDTKRFTEWRKNMARRIGAKILQIAQATQIPEDQYYQVLRTAASYVMTYDPELAQWFMAQANSRIGTQEKLNKKAKSISKDDHVVMSKEKQNFYDFSKGAEGTQDQRDVAAAEYQRLQLLEEYLGGRYPMYTWMTGYLRGFRNAGGTYEGAISNIVHNYNPDEEPGYEYRSLAGADGAEPDTALEDLKSAMGLSNKTAPKGSNKPVVKNESAPGNNSNAGYTGLQGDGTYSYIKLKHNALGGYNAPADHAMASMSNDLNNAETSEQLTNIIGAIEEYETIPGAKSVESLKKRADEKMKVLTEKEKELEKLKKEGLADKPAFLRAFDKILGSGRTATSMNAMMTAFHNVVASADKSQSPLTFLNSILLAQLPFYKPTDYDDKVALEIKGADSLANLSKVIENLGVPFFSKLAKYKNIDAAVDYALQDFTRTFSDQYNNWFKDAKTAEEKKQIVDALRSRWNFGPRDFEIMRGGQLPVGEVRQKLMKKAAKEYGKTYVDDNGNTVDSKTGKIIKKYVSPEEDLEIQGEDVKAEDVEI